MRFCEKTETKAPYYRFHEEWEEGVGLFVVLTVTLYVKPELMGQAI